MKNHSACTVAGVAGCCVCVAVLLLLASGCATPTPRVPAGPLLDTYAAVPEDLAVSFSAPETEGWSPDKPEDWQVIEGRYVALTREDSATVSLYRSAPWANGLVEVDYIREAGSVGAGGLVLRATRDFRPWLRGGGYLFAIGSDGDSWQLAVFTQKGRSMSYLQEWMPVEGVGFGTNRLAVLARGALLQFYINGDLKWERYDDTFARGEMGVFATTSPGFETAHVFDNVAIKLETSLQALSRAESVAVAETGSAEPSEAPPVAVHEPDAAPSSIFRTPDAAPGLPDRSPQIRPGFVIRISVLVSGKREIDSEVKRVSGTGQLDLPLVGAITAEGMTLEQLSATLQRRYQDYFVNPQVVAEFVVEDRPDAISPWGSVVVLGRVRTPGRVNIPPTQDLTVSGAIQLAGGLDTSARSSSIRLTRQKDDGKRERITVDLTAVGQQGRVENDLILRPGDLIFVPERIF
ncbi:MAG TPA: polysaccharide biosynthesis/export family protein [Kiritimatiellia bacterium]|nr:polysaccharide biosynthesis/export family protein [Kiritimatiellia bacterium]